MDAVRYINGTRLDDRIIRTDWDAGFVEGRQYGRGKHGGQVKEKSDSKGPGVAMGALFSLPLACRCCIFQFFVLELESFSSLAPLLLALANLIRFWGKYGQIARF